MVRERRLFAVPYKECPQCGSWAYSASSLPKWECPECETDMSDVPSQDTPPPGTYEEFQRVSEVYLKKEVIMSVRRSKRTI